jgi:hypothetical protein
MLTGDRGLEVYGTQCRSNRLARFLESERKRARGQHRRQQGQPVEGEAERRMGVREDD